MNRDFYGAQERTTSCKTQTQRERACTGRNVLFMAKGGRSFGKGTMRLVDVITPGDWYTGPSVAELRAEGQGFSRGRIQKDISGCRIQQRIGVC